MQKNEKNGKCNIGLRNACYVCDYLTPADEEISIRIKYFRGVQEMSGNDNRGGIGFTGKKGGETVAKFDYEIFYGDYMAIGFNAKKYTEEQALKIAAKELDADIEQLTIEPAFIYYGYGTDEAGEKRQGYWLTMEPRGNTIDAWAVIY